MANNIIKGELTYRGKGIEDSSTGYWGYDSMLFEKEDGTQVRVKNVSVPGDFPLALSPDMSGTFYFQKSNLIAVEVGGKVYYSPEMSDFSTAKSIFFVIGGLVSMFFALIFALLVITAPLAMALAKLAGVLLGKPMLAKKYKAYLRENNLWDPDRFQAI